MDLGTSQTNTTVPWRPAHQKLKQGMRRTKGLYDTGQIEKAFTPVGRPGESILDLNATQRSAMDMITGGAMGSAPYLQGAQGALGNIASGNIQIDPISMGNLDAVTGNILDQVMPEVNSVFANSGMDGSPMHQAELARAASSAIAPAQYNAFMQVQGANQNAQGQNIANMMGAAGMAPSLASAMSIPGQQVLGVGNQMYGVDQAQKADRQADRQAMRMAPIEAQTYYNDQMRAFGGMGGTRSGSETPGALDVIGGLGQAGISGAIGYGLLTNPAATLGFLCDRRLKRDIMPLGMWRGVMLYAFRYLWDDVLRVGPMAQEVPERARLRFGPWLGVDMGAL